MLRDEIIIALLSRIKYERQPHWQIHLCMDDVYEKGKGVTTVAEPDGLIGIYLQVRSYGPKPEDHWSGRKWRLSRHMTATELVCTAFKAIMAAEEHEIREFFTYKGRAVFGPHFDVEALVELADSGRVDVRSDAMQGA